MVTRQLPVQVVRGGSTEAGTDVVVAEYELEVTWNGRYLATLVCTPSGLRELVAGFLYTTGFVDRREQLLRLDIDADCGRADVETSGPPAGLVLREAVLTGCGGRPMPVLARAQPVTGGAPVPAARLWLLSRQLQTRCPLFQATGGAHVAGLARPDHSDLEVVREDIGRHNAVDKVAGQALLDGATGLYDVLVISGRISSDMVLKASRLGVPLLVSRSAPTGRAVTMAEEAGITLVGFCRGERFNVYTHPQRISTSPLS